MDINRIINLIAAITLIEMMVTIGLAASISEVTGVTRDWWLLIRAAIANYVLVPAAAVLLLTMFQAPPMVAIGFLIAAVCPGAPFAPPFTRMAGGNVVVAVGLMIALAGSSAVMAPLLLKLGIPMVAGEQPLSIGVGRMIGVLLGAQLLPLCIGLGVRRMLPELARKAQKGMSRVSAVLNLITLGMIIVVQLRMLSEIRFRAYVGMLLLVLAGVAAGWLLGGPGRANRTAMAMVTSVRNVGVTTVVATGSFAGTGAVTAATAFAVFQTLVVALIALAWGRVPHSTSPVADGATQP
jgi:bile acid:Na+ symporter, BASS family